MFIYKTTVRGRNPKDQFEAMWDCPRCYTAYCSYGRTELEVRRSALSRGYPRCKKCKRVCDDYIPREYE